MIYVIGIQTFSVGMISEGYVTESMVVRLLIDLCCGLLGTVSRLVQQFQVGKYRM